MYAAGSERLAAIACGCCPALVSSGEQSKEHGALKMEQPPGDQE